MTSRALVPLDQEYGTRGQTEAAIGQALPGGSPLPAAASMPPDMLMETEPTKMLPIQEILAAQSEPAAPVDPRQRLRDIRDTTPNSILRELLTRTLGE